MYSTAYDVTSIKIACFGHKFYAAFVQLKSVSVYYSDVVILLWWIYSLDELILVITDLKFWSHYYKLSLSTWVVYEG